MIHRLKSLASGIRVMMQMREYRHAPDDMLASKVEARTDIDNIAERFNKLGIPVEDVVIDVSDFDYWRIEYPEIEGFYKGHGDVRVEKILEHYLTMKYLNFNKEDVFIDIASSTSPFAEIVSAHLGNRTYRQDLIFEMGINGNTIGGDAGALPLHDGFADVMALHCAFECFQGNSDVRFVREAARVLRPGGRLGIVPLYMDDIYFVKTGPKCDKRKVNVENGARWIWRDDQYESEPFSRHYSPESFRDRIIDGLKEMSYEVLRFVNLDGLMEREKGQRIYCHFMFRAKRP